MKRERRAAARLAAYQTMQSAIGSLVFCVNLDERVNFDGNLDAEQVDVAVKMFRDYLGQLSGYLARRSPGRT